MDGLSASDIALLGNENGMGGNAFMWIFALLILAGGGFNGFGNRGDYGQFATAASQQDILFSSKFEALDNKIDRIGNGIADATFALNNSIKDGNAAVAGRVIDEGRAIQTQLCAINSNIDNKFAALEKSQLEQRIAEQAQQINQLSMAQMLCGIPKVNNTAWGVYPYANQGCGCTSLATI